MICDACNAEMTEGSIFCPKCGHRVTGDGEAEALAAEAGSAAVPPAKPVPEATRESPAERIRAAATGEAGTDYDPEEELWTGSYSGKALIGAWVGAGVLTVGIGALLIWQMESVGMALLYSLGVGAVLFALIGLYLGYRKLSVGYELTSQRFIHRKGLLRRVTDRIEVIDMDDVTFVQGIVQRMVGVGTIQIISSDRSHPELNLLGIENVKYVAGLIDDVRRKERRRRGLHIEAI